LAAKHHEGIMLHAPISEARKSLALGNTPNQIRSTYQNAEPHEELNTQSIYGNQAVLRTLSELGYGPAAGAPAANPAVGGGGAPAPVVALGPIEQARSDVAAALDHTVERLKDAIALRDANGIVGHDVDEALCRYFPGFDYKFLDDALARVQPMSQWISNVPVMSVPRPAPAGFRDAVLLNGVTTPAHTLIRRVLPLMDPGPDYVVVFPDWYTDADLRATRLLHEFFHFLFVGMFHDKPLNDAFGWQGFVSDVGGLTIGPTVVGLYPSCK